MTHSLHGRIRMRLEVFDCLCSCLPSGPLVYFLQQVDKALSRASPFAAVGVVVGTVYWSAVTYGAVTVMQVHRANEIFHRESVKPEGVTVCSPLYVLVCRLWDIRRVCT